MRRVFTDDYHSQRNVYVGPDRRAPKPYGFFRFLVDATMTLLTSGLWLIWIFVREMRK
jgi:hypothetical protein